MEFYKNMAIGLLITFIGLTMAGSLMAQPGYYNQPPPGYIPPPPQYIPPPAMQRPYYGNRFYGNRGGYGRNMPFNRFNNTPWNRFGNNWGNNSNTYGPDTDWFTDTPRRWMRKGPKDGAGQVFDDFLDAPSRMGEVRGWSAPTVSVPNPIDVADELERGSKDIFRYNND